MIFPTNSINLHLKLRINSHRCYYIFIFYTNYHLQAHTHRTPPPTPSALCKQYLNIIQQAHVNIPPRASLLTVQGKLRIISAKLESSAHFKG